MFQRSFLIAAILSLAGVLTATNVTLAQKGGGGGKGGGAGGGARPGGGTPGGGARPGAGMPGGGAHPGGGSINRGGYYGGIGYGYGGIGFGIGGLGYGYGSLYGSPYYNTLPLQYNNFGPQYSYYPPSANYYVQPYQYQPPQPVGNAATIHVLLPDPEAKVWFDGTPTTSTGTERLFHTPDLEPGSPYTYRLRASWTMNGQPMVQELVVSVASGRVSLADFTRPVSDDGPPPAAK